MSVQKITDPYKIIQTAGDTYQGNDLDQTYSINPDLIGAGDMISIIDQGGQNTIELVGGLSIESSLVVANEIILTLSNGAKIDVRDADTFNFNVGANLAAGKLGAVKTFIEFVEQDLGLNIPEAGDPLVEGSAAIIGEDTPISDTIAPIITTATASYAENSEEGTVVFAVSADPIETDAVYSIESGNDNAFYAIDADTGEISLTQIGSASAANDFEAVTGETTATNSFALGVKVTDAAGNMSDVVDVVLSVTDVNDTSLDNTNTINISATDVSTHQGTNGIAETFIYEIDSTNFIIESRESDNISLQGFNVLEDKLIFQDVATGTTSTAFFIDDALMSSASDTQITFEALLVNNDDIVIAEDGFSLTLVGITDFSAIDYIVV